ncbi:MAG: hypothetical protein WKG06_46785 [Segetibacter sp.]
MLIGFWIAGLVAEKYTIANGHNWKSIWMIPAAIALVVFLLYAVLFKDDKKKIISPSEAEKGSGYQSGYLNINKNEKANDPPRGI